MSASVELKQSLRSELENFLRYLSDQRQYAAHTVNNYQRHITNAAIFIQNHNVENWEQVNAEHIKAWIIECRSKQLKPRSISLILSSLRSFYKYLLANDIVIHNPLSGISAPKTDKPLPKNLDVDQMSQLLEIAPEDELAIRDRAMMELMYSSGLRLDELVNADLSQLDDVNQEILVVGKGNKERILPVGKAALDWIDQWLQVRR